jgi:hypothetical protein
MSKYGPALKVKRVSELLSCGVRTVYELCEAGVLKWFRLKPGSRKGIRVLAESVDELMNPKDVVVTPQPQQQPPTPKPAANKPRAREFKGTIVNFRQ